MCQWVFIKMIVWSRKPSVPARVVSEATVFVTSSVLDVHVTLPLLAKCTSRTGSHDVTNNRDLPTPEYLEGVDDTSFFLWHAP